MYISLNDYSTIIKTEYIYLTVGFIINEMPNNPTNAYHQKESNFKEISCITPFLGNFEALSYYMGMLICTDIFESVQLSISG